MKIHKIGLIASIYLTGLTVVIAKSNTVEYLFMKKIALLKINKQLKVIDIKKDIDFFWLPLLECMPNFYDNQQGMQSYRLEDKEKTNRIGVVEYVFNSKAAAVKSYNMVFPYSETERKLARELFGTRCYSLPDPRPFYASIEGTHVFLYTVYYNFYYKTSKESVETNIKNDKKILLDDLYRQMTLAMQ